MSSYGTCPLCGSDGISRCKCELSDTQCANGHHWHFYKGKVHLGYANHANFDDHEGCRVVSSKGLPQRFSRADGQRAALRAAGRLKLMLKDPQWLRGVGIGETEQGEPTVEVRVDKPVHAAVLPKEIDGIAIRALAVGNISFQGMPTTLPRSKSGAVFGMSDAEFKEGWDLGVLDGQRAKTLPAGVDPKLLTPHFDAARSVFWQKGYTAGFVKETGAAPAPYVSTDEAPATHTVEVSSPFGTALKWGLGLAVAGGATYAAYAIFQKKHAQPSPAPSLPSSPLASPELPPQTAESATIPEAAPAVVEAPSQPGPEKP